MREVTQGAHPGQTTEANSIDFDGEIRRANGALREAVASAQGVPGSARRWSYWARRRNDAFIGALRGAALRELEERGDAPVDHAFALAAVRRAWRSPWRFVWRSSARGLAALLGGERPDSHVILSVVRALQGGFSSWQHTQATLETTYAGLIAPDRVQRAAFDVLAMWLLAGAALTSPRSPDSVTALALLHPLCDDAADAGELDREGAKRIADAVRGTLPTPKSRFEEAVFALIATLHAAHVGAGQPDLTELLARLHDAQLAQTAVTAKTSTTDMLDNLFERGGLTMAAFAWLALDGLTSPTFAAIYRAGAVLQLLDDLEDAESDAKAGVQTPWTRALAQGQSLRHPTQSTLAAWRVAERALTALPDPWTRTQTDQLIGIYWLLLARGVVSLPNPLRSQAAKALTPHLPVGLTTLDRLRSELLAAVNAAERINPGGTIGLVRAWLTAGRPLDSDHPPPPKGAARAVADLLNPVRDVPDASELDRAFEALARALSGESASAKRAKGASSRGGARNG